MSKRKGSSKGKSWHAGNGVFQPSLAQRQLYSIRKRQAQIDNAMRGIAMLTGRKP